MKVQGCKAKAVKEEGVSDTPYSEGARRAVYGERFKFKVEG